MAYTLNLRFVKTIQEPVNRNSSNNAKWQEASQKDVERGFGVLQRKFHILVKRLEQWYVEEISDVVLTCVVLHNATVAHRISSGEVDGCSFMNVLMKRMNPMQLQQGTKKKQWTDG